MNYNDQLFAAITAADWPASTSLHHFVLFLDGSHEAAGKNDADQLERKQIQPG